VVALAPVALLAAIVALSVRKAGAKAGPSALAVLAFLAVTALTAAAKIYKVALPVQHLLELVPVLSLAAAVHYVRVPVVRPARARIGRRAGPASRHPTRLLSARSPIHPPAPSPS